MVERKEKASTLIRRVNNTVAKVIRGHLEGEKEPARHRAHTRVCMCNAYVSLCPCVSVHTCACVRMCVCTCTRVSECTHTCLSGCEYARASVPVCVCVHVCVCVCASVFECMRMCRCMHVSLWPALVWEASEVWVHLTTGAATGGGGARSLKGSVCWVQWAGSGVRGHV